MAEAEDAKFGCGLLTAVFGKKGGGGGGIWSRRGTSTTTTGSIPPVATTTTSTVKTNPHNNLVISPSFAKRRKNQDEYMVSNGGSVLHQGPPYHHHQKQPIVIHHQPAKVSPSNSHSHQQPSSPARAITTTTTTTTRTNTKSSPGRTISTTKRTNNNVNGANGSNGRVSKDQAMGICDELESMIDDYQRDHNGGSSNLVRASSSNVMLYGNLGNLRQQQPRQGDHVVHHQKEDMNMSNKGGKSNGKYLNSVMGNVVVKKKQSDSQSSHQPPPPPTSSSICRALSTRMDPEQLKILGNEDYKNGNFAEALALYEAAIAIDPNKAAYRSNKSAALTALGRLLDAVYECKEAIRIEPNYHRAHHRLANLYLRLGDIEKSIYHYKRAGPEADHIDISKAKSLQVHLNKCTESRRVRDWNTLIKEAEAAIAGGADSAPQVHALQAEALMKHNKHQEADEVMKQSLNLDADACTKFFGPVASASILAARAHVDMAMGRFDEALAKAQQAMRLDTNNREASTVMRKARAVAAARANGNRLFKVGKFQDALAMYEEGLEHDPHNSVLLCNRAACRSKLGQFEKAVHDCSSALNVRPGFAKARLRRADCYAKLEKWEASIEDYEILLRKLPEDEEVKQGLLEAKARLKKQRGEKM